jgi:integrase
MSTDDIKYHEDLILVSIPKTKNNLPREFVITEETWINLVKSYAALRPKNTTNKRFFFTCRNGRCVNNPIGINTMGKVSKEIATFLRLPQPELYTGHCFRRSSATQLANRGGDLLTLKHHGGWKSSNLWVFPTRGRNNAYNWR